MADSNLQLQWTDDQWNKVRQVVYEEARRARVAGNVLPLYGPLEPDASFVARQDLHGTSRDPAGFTVADRDTLQLLTIQERVTLRGAQVADPELSSALIAFRRAANVLARREDEIVFNGRGAADDEPGAARDIGGGGLVAAAGMVLPVGQPRGTRGDALVTAVSTAIGELERRFHLGPFACLLGQQYFVDVQTPDGSAVLPQDRILSFLGGGALLRTSVLEQEQGLVIALGGAPIDLVVATDISVSFLQVTLDPWFVFRVYEKIVLRIKEPNAIVLLGPGGPPHPDDIVALASDYESLDDEGTDEEDADEPVSSPEGPEKGGEAVKPESESAGNGKSIAQKGIEFGEHSR